MLNEEMLEKVWKVVKVKMRLEDDELKDTLMISIQEIGYRILHYCNIHEIPKQLVYVWASMAIELIKIDFSYLDEIEDVTTDNSSVKVGDTTVGSGSGSSGGGGGSSTKERSNVDDVVIGYKADLNHYRKLRC